MNEGLARARKLNLTLSANASNKAVFDAQVDFCNESFTPSL